MNHGWEYKRLGEVCKINMGQSPNSGSYNDKKEGLPFFQGSSDFGQYYPVITKYCSAPSRIANEDDILFSVRAPIGSMNFAPQKVCIGRGLCSISAQDRLIQKFIYYWLKRTNYKLQEKGKGIIFKAIGKEIINSHPIPVPPKEQQEAIVAELDAINEAIDVKRKQLAALDTLAKSIFYDTFGDPITNPKAWPVKLLPDMCKSILTGLTYKPENVSDSGTIVLRSGNIQESRLVFDNVVRINLHLKPKYYAQANDILMCSRNGSARLVGKVALIPILKEDVSWGAFMTIIRSDYHKMLFYFFQLPCFKEQLSRTKTATINQITISMLNKISVPFPPLALQNSFAAQIGEIEREKANVEATIAKLQTLLDSRMDYWFND